MVPSMIVADDRVLRRFDDRREQCVRLFVLLALGDIGERDDGAIDEVVEVSVRADLHQVGASLPRN